MPQTLSTKTPLKILYGVQANGNSHIARARTIIPQLRKAGADVHCLFSGRPREEFFDMDVFGDFNVGAGFPVIIENGRVNMLKTAFNFKGNGIICNAGFELPSEAIQFSKKLLVKPLDGMMEQASNALALERLNLGSAMRTLEAKIVAEWIERDDYAKATYPDVTSGFAEWIAGRDWDNPEPLIREMWEKTKFSP
ncbi:MAG TPA: glycosyltransferase family protein [Micavibrio sp.]|jgi:UDP:flavonoid glycosyltransferase YjiC (YdhE family)